MTEEEQSSPSKLEFEIFNMPFRLRARMDEHERLRRAARHVDNLVRNLSSSQVTPDTTRLALQAALLITVEHFKMIDDVTTAHGLTDDVRRRVDDIIERLDEQLAEFQ